MSNANSSSSSSSETKLDVNLYSRQLGVFGFEA